MLDPLIFKLKWFDFCLSEDVCWGDWMEDNNFSNNMSTISPFINLI
jgi:hypothetical protein